MSDEIQKVAVGTLPPGIEKFAKDATFNKLENILPGDQYSAVRESLKNNGIAESKDFKLAVDFDKEGNVVALAAAVPRLPSNSEEWLRKNVPDFYTVGASPNNVGSDFATRNNRIDLFYRIASQEGVVNNAIKKTASLVAQNGAFKIRSARQGKRPPKTVSQELLKLLTYWQENVNSADLQQIITGSRGLKQIIRRGSRQAMIEGDLFLRQFWKDETVPALDSKKYSLPMLLQAIPSQQIWVPQDVGVGLEVYYWQPGAKFLQAIKSSDKNVQRVVAETLTPKVIEQLKTKGKVLLDSSLLVHIKHGGVDSQTFGKSMIEPTLTDLAYSRSLKMLDFVTIDSLVNRMLILKIGDKDPKSDYHNLAVAQQRVNVFRKLLTGDIGPNMMIVWAGHDIEKLDVGAHDSVMNTDTRHQIAKDNLKLSLGVPDSVLMGSVEGGAKGAGWLGFIALSTVAEELREEFGQVITELGRRIAIENNFDEIDLVWEFNQTLLADKEANSKVMLQAYDRGLLSRRSTLEELDKDFDAERIRKQDEEEEGDDELFTPPPPATPLGGPNGGQGTAPKAQPGRPSKSGNTNTIETTPQKPIKPTKND